MARTTPNVLQKIGWTLAGIAIAGIPTWVYLLVRLLLSPEGFWQEAALGGCGIYFGGSVQVILLGILCWFLTHLWLDEL